MSVRHREPKISSEAVFVFGATTFSVVASMILIDLLNTPFSTHSVVSEQKPISITELIKKEISSKSEAKSPEKPAILHELRAIVSHDRIVKSQGASELVLNQTLKQETKPKIRQANHANRQSKIARLETQRDKHEFAQVISQFEEDLDFQNLTKSFRKNFYLAVASQWELKTARVNLPQLSTHRQLESEKQADPVIAAVKSNESKDVDVDKVQMSRAAPSQGPTPELNLPALALIEIKKKQKNIQELDVPSEPIAFRVNAIPKPGVVRVLKRKVSPFLDTQQKMSIQNDNGRRFLHKPEAPFQKAQQIKEETLKPVSTSPGGTQQRTVSQENRESDYPLTIAELEGEIQPAVNATSGIHDKLVSSQASQMRVFSGGTLNESPRKAPNYKRSAVIPSLIKQTDLGAPTDGRRPFKNEASKEATTEVKEVGKTNEETPQEGSNESIEGPDENRPDIPAEPSRGPDPNPTTQIDTKCRELDSPIYESFSLRGVQNQAETPIPLRELIPLTDEDPTGACVKKLKGWVQIKAPLMLDTLFWSTQRAEVLSNSQAHMLGATSGVQIQNGAAIVYGRIPAGYRAMLSGRSEPPLYIEESTAPLLETEDSTERYFAFANVTSGAKLLYFVENVTGKSGAVALPAVSTKATYIDLRAMEPVAISGVLWNADSAANKKEPLKGAHISAIGFEGLAGFADDEGKFEFKEVWSISDLPIFLQVSAAGRSAHRFRWQKSADESISHEYFVLSNEQIKGFSDQLEGGINFGSPKNSIEDLNEDSVGSGVMIAALDGLIEREERHPGGAVYSGVKILDQDAETGPETYILNARGELQVSKRLSKVDSRVLVTNLPEGPAIFFLEDKEQNIIWSEMQYFSPGTVSVVGPYLE